MFWWKDSLPKVELGFTNRYSGFSSGIFSEFNLSVNVGEDLLNVYSNRILLKEHLGARYLFFMKQVHGNDVVFVDSDFNENVEIVADGLVTNVPGVALAVLVADCVPVVFVDVEVGVIGVAHAGRQGMLLGVVSNVVRTMFSKGAKKIKALVGPAICGLCYEVPFSLQEEVVEKIPETFSVTRWGTSGLNLVSGVCAQLFALGVEVFDFSACSFENFALYSYRRRVDTGRFAGFVSLQK